MSVTELKKERNDLKSQIHNLSKRVTSGIDRDARATVIDTSWHDLERLYEDFLRVNGEYESLVSNDPQLSEHKVVKGLDLEAFKAEVISDYETAKQRYETYQENSKSNNSSPAIADVLTMLTTALQSKSDDNQALSQAIISLTSKVQSFEVVANQLSTRLETSNIDQVNTVNPTTSNVPITSHINCSNNGVPSESSLFTSQTALPVTSINHFTDNVSTRSESNTIESLNNTNEVISSSSDLNLEQLSAYIASASLSQSIHPNVTDYSSHSNQYVLGNSANINSFPLVGQPPMCPIMSPSSIVSSSSPIHQANSIYSDYRQPHTASLYRNQVQPSVIPSVQELPHGQHLPPLYPLYSQSLPSTTPSATTLYNNLNALSNQHNGSHPVHNQPSQIGYIQPTEPAQASYSVSNTSFNSAAGTRFKFGKLTIPTFDGNRSKWPEFRNLWLSIVVPSMPLLEELALRLRESITGGEAKRIVDTVWITSGSAYNIIWERLCKYYDDTSASVEACLVSLQNLKPVREQDYRSLVSFIDNVEKVYYQLLELKMLQCITILYVDKICDCLPFTVSSEWHKLYYTLPQTAKLQPFSSFVSFLNHTRNSVARLAERQSLNKPPIRERTVTHHTDLGERSAFASCAVHQKDGTKHETKDCQVFQKMSLDDKLAALKSVRACFRCFLNHHRKHCTSDDPCSTCGDTRHHSLMCRKACEHEDKSPTNKTESHSSRQAERGVLAIQQASVAGSRKRVTVMMDQCSDSSYITFDAAKRFNAKRIESCTLEVTTTGGKQTEFKSAVYVITLLTVEGKEVDVTAYGLEHITKKIAPLNMSVIQELFPRMNVSELQRGSDEVDILLGNTLFGVHPKNEIATAGSNLSIMSGSFGLCLVGHHPSLDEVIQLDSHMVSVLHEANLQTHSHHTEVSHKGFIRPYNTNKHSVVSHLTQAQNAEITRFIQGDELGTDIAVKCGACRCGKCPIPGHTYSFTEEQELKLIQEGLKYRAEEQCWISTYPWSKDPSLLPNNYSNVLACLKSTERTLLKDPTWGTVYNQQMDDMLERGVSRKLTAEEIANWKGPTFYIAHIAVKNPKSTSTPVRIVFNSSQICNGESLNGALCKGPDAYLNSLLGILLRWREKPIAIVGDIKKMFNSVHIEMVEQQCHRYLWRHLDTSREPDIYVMTRVNMGDRPAGCISTEAVYKTANMFEADSPVAADILRHSTYVDDIVSSVSGSVDDAKHLTNECENMLNKGGFKIKHWIFSGDSRPEDEDLRVLGVGWHPEADKIAFKIALNFSPKRQGVHTEPNLTQEQVPAAIPLKLTRRIVLSQVQKLHDPLGFMTPVTLVAKTYLRETWSLKLSWDEPLPQDLTLKWCKYFTDLYQLEKFKYDRCLEPANSMGDPTLVILSDGSDLSYGFAAYIRWKLEGGGIWCRLIMSKSRIAPMTKLSTPRMELNGAVLSKRGRAVIESEFRTKFERVLHLVDSETVLSMIQKVSHRFNIYEGVRIGEIQAASDGDMSSWAWIPGTENISDWTTRCKSPEDINPESAWVQGPPFLYKPEEDWGLKFTCSIPDSELLPGEKKSVVTHLSQVQKSMFNYTMSSMPRIIWVIVRILKLFKDQQSLSLGYADLYKCAEIIVIKDIQKSMNSELEKVDRKGRIGGVYASLRPVVNEHGIWVVGSRMTENPMTLHGDPQALLPYSHAATKLYMIQAHKESVHRGRDATLARFRLNFWTPHGSKLANVVKHQCQLCRLRDRIMISQQMGILPPIRLRPAPAFNSTMVDIFGPFGIRGEVQKRTTGKGYGVIFTDLCSRAVHIEATFGYDTSSFLLSLSRFVNIRGYPSHMYSDPGSQLVGADTELREAWNLIDHQRVERVGAEKGMTWHFGPADSSWYQGAVESLIAGVKRSFKFTMSKNTRLSANEFLTACYEVANTLNERPIGASPSPDSCLNILTPNCLLLGRATKQNPGGWQPTLKVNSRFSYTQQVVSDFWKHWIELYAPTLVYQSKWHTACRNLQPDDVVVVGDSTFRGDYRLARVIEAIPGEDGKVRKVTLAYKNYKVGEKVNVYKGCKDTVVTRGVRRLSLVVPVEQLE